MYHVPMECQRILQPTILPRSDWEGSIETHDDQNASTCMPPVILDVDLRFPPQIHP